MTEENVIETSALATTIPVEGFPAIVQSGIPANLPVKPEEKPIVNNARMVDLYEEALKYCREDRQDAGITYEALLNMVINDGDASSSTKEAMIAALKIRVDSVSNMNKTMDMLMRYILKERDTFPRYLSTKQENKFVNKEENNFIIKGDRRKFIEQIHEKGNKDE